MSRHTRTRIRTSSHLVAMMIATTLAIALADTPPAAALGLTSWVQLHPAHSPPARSNGGMAYDAATGQAVLYGGWGDPTTDTASGNPGTTYYGDTWTWDGHDWSQACGSCGPGTVDMPTNEQTPMVYDPVHHDIVMWVWATYSSHTGSLDLVQSTWVWNGSSWSQACSKCFGTTNMDWGTMAFDPNLGEPVLYMNYATDGSPVQRTYAWTGSSWTDVGAGPMVSGGIAAGTDFAGKRVVMYTTGGTFDWNGSSWTGETGAQPTPFRYSTAMAYDPISPGVVLFGGGTSGSAPATQSDAWLNSGDTWTGTAAGPTVRENESLADGTAPTITSPNGTPVLLFGGQDDNGAFLSDTWVLGAGQAQIARAQLDFAARAQRRLAKLRTLVTTLGTQERKLEGEIVAEHAKADAAAAAVQSLTARLAKIDAEIPPTLDALGRLRRAEQSAPTDIRRLLEQEDSDEAQIDRLSTQIVTAQTNGTDASALKVALNKVQKQLDAVDAILKQKLAGTALGDLHSEWLTRLRALEALSRQLHDEESRQLGIQGAADAAVTALADQLGPVYIELLQAGERLAGFDPEVDGVTAAVSGQTVFTAKPTITYAKLLAINQAIDEQKSLVAEIEVAKHSAFEDFKAAELDAIAAGNHLYEVLLRSAYLNYAVDLAFDTYDIVKATAKGGVVGAAAEFGKKLMEKAISKAIESDPGIEPGSIAAAVNAEFKAGLKDAYSRPQITRVVTERVLKDTISKGIKDGLVNKYIGSVVFKKVEVPFRQLIQDSPVTPGELASQVESFTLKIKRVERLQDQLKNLKKGYFSNFTSKSSLQKFFKGEAENFAKDALKSVIKGQLDRADREAWTEYFVKDAFAHGLYDPYFELASLWEQALTREDELLATKASMLQGANPNGGLLTGTSVRFARGATVEITLQLSGFQDPSDPLQVFLGGVQATATAPGTYTVSSQSATPDADGTLTITLR